MSSVAIRGSLPALSQHCTVVTGHCVHLWTDCRCPVPSGPGGRNLKYGCARVFQAAYQGHFEPGSVCPVGWEPLMPQPLMRRIARRVVQGAVMAAGILV